jgi:hypothetical protein
LGRLHSVDELFHVGEPIHFVRQQLGPVGRQTGLTARPQHFPLNATMFFFANGSYKKSNHYFRRQNLPKCLHRRDSTKETIKLAFLNLFLKLYLLQKVKMLQKFQQNIL